MSDLIYRGWVPVEDLLVGQCTIHRAANAKATWWLLWFYARRDIDGVPEEFAVPVNPNGSCMEAGPGGKTWGLTKTDAGIWQVSPSIYVTVKREIHPDGHEDVPIYHQTPRIVGVPEIDYWTEAEAEP